MIINQEDLSKQAELRKMKFIATALLILAFIIFVLASIFEEVSIWVGFVRATAEAAMVGALADWFAVTALFRHPLHLKIPHTAIIPNRKDILGENLGRFVRNNFLAKEVILDKLRSMDLTRTVAKWLIQPDHSAQIARYVAVGLATVVQVIKSEDVQDLIAHSVAEQIRSTHLAPLFGSLLSILTSDSRGHELLYGTVHLGARLLEENKEAIQQKISQETPWWLPQSVDKAIYQKIVDTIEETLQEIRDNPEHPLYEQFKLLIARFTEDLKHSPEIKSKEADFKEELLQHDIVQEFASSLWLDIRKLLVEQSTNPNLEVRKSIQQGLISFGEAVLRDEALLEEIDLWVEQGMLYMIKEYGYEVEYLIANTIKRWDAEATSRKIELQIGKDLQFIRINGALVGGLAGFIIHAFSLLL